MTTPYPPIPENADLIRPSQIYQNPEGTRRGYILCPLKGDLHDLFLFDGEGRLLKSTLVKGLNKARTALILALRAAA